MIAKPGLMDRGGIERQGIFGEADNLSGRRKCGGPFAPLALRNLMSLVIRSELLQEAQPPQGSPSQAL